MAGLLVEQLLAMMIVDNKNGMKRMKLVIGLQDNIFKAGFPAASFFYTFFQIWVQNFPPLV